MAVPAKLAAQSQRRADVRPAPKLGGKRERTRKKILEAAFGLNGLTLLVLTSCIF